MNDENNAGTNMGDDDHQDSDEMKKKLSEEGVDIESAPDETEEEEEEDEEDGSDGDTE